MKKFKPDYFYNNIDDIDINFINTFDFIFFDVDNTLVKPETSYTTPEIEQWISKIKKENTYIISNSHHINQRKKDLEKKFNIKVFNRKYKKPSSLLCDQLKEKLNLKNKKIVFIGDQIFPDIFFSQRCNFTSILVKQNFPEKRIFLKLYNFIQNIFIKIIKK